MATVNSSFTHGASWRAYGGDSWEISWTNNLGSKILIEKLTIPIASGNDGSIYGSDGLVTISQSATVRCTIDGTSNYQEKTINYKVSIENQGSAGSSGWFYGLDEANTIDFNFNPSYSLNSGSTIKFILRVTNSNSAASVRRSGGPSTTNYKLTYSPATYTVTFQDWNGTVLKTQMVDHGGNATPPANPTRTGYTFDGWSGSYTNVTSNRTITATYIINQYTLTYNKNGATGAPPASHTVNYNASVNLRSWSTTPKQYTITYNAGGGTLSPLSKTVDCTFYRWNTNSGGTGTDYPASYSYTITQNVTLFAKWTNPTAGTLDIPSRAGYEFIGWFDSQGARITSSTTITSNLTIFAHWNILPIWIYNGTSWERIRKVYKYEGENWVEIVPKKWNGSAWVDIT